MAPDCGAFYTPCHDPTWDARSTTFYDAGNVQGWGAKFPETGWAPLEEIKEHKWARLEPRRVRIFAARFIQGGRVAGAGATFH